VTPLKSSTVFPQLTPLQHLAISRYLARRKKLNPIVGAEGSSLSAGVSPLVDLAGALSSDWTLRLPPFDISYTFAEACPSRRSSFLALVSCLDDLRLCKSSKTHYCRYHHHLGSLAYPEGGYRKGEGLKFNPPFEYSGIS